MPHQHAAQYAAHHVTGQAKQTAHWNHAWQAIHHAVRQAAHHAAWHGIHHAVRHGIQHAVTVSYPDQTDQNAA